MMQLSHLYMTTGKTIGLTRRTFVSKVMSLLFSMLSMVVIPSFLTDLRLQEGPLSSCTFGWRAPWLASIPEASMGGDMGLEYRKMTIVRAQDCKVQKWQKWLPVLDSWAITNPDGLFFVSLRSSGISS